RQVLLRLARRRHQPVFPIDRGAQSRRDQVSAARRTLMFLTLEGVDGAGKSSHIEFVADAMRTKGAHVVVTREPGGTDLAERLRHAILEEPMTPVISTLLVFAGRADHVARVIKPALASGQTVICDRFTDATVAYQGAGEGVSAELIASLAKAAHAGLQPDRTLLFDCPYEV